MISNYDKVCDYYGGRLWEEGDRISAKPGDCVTTPHDGACSMPGSVRVDAVCVSDPMMYVSAACAAQQKGACVLEQTYDAQARLQQARCKCPEEPHLRIVTNTAQTTPHASVNGPDGALPANACDWLTSRGELVCGTKSAPRSCADVGRMCQKLHGDDDGQIARCVRVASSRISDGGVLSDAATTVQGAMDRCCTYWSPDACRIQLQEGAQACKWVPASSTAVVHPSVDCSDCGGSDCPPACTAKDNSEMDLNDCRRVRTILE